MTAIAAALRDAIARLEQSSPSPGLDAEVLLAHVLDKPRSYLTAWPARTLDAEALAYFDRLIGRREKGEPVAYLTGGREFWSLQLRVNQHVLIPRPDTEALVERVSALVTSTSARRLLDLGTGSGAVALALAYQHRQLQVVGVEVCRQALSLAEQNRQSLGLRNVDLVQSDWFEHVEGLFDLVVGNPPYVASADRHLTQDDVAFEPRLALDGGVDGLASIRTIVSGVHRHLRAFGWLLLEHGFDQGEAVRELLSAADFTEVTTRRDLSGNDRFTEGRRSVPIE